MASGEFDEIVVSKMDRLGRSLGMILRFWDDAEAAGARVIVIDQGIDTSTASGRLQRNMLAALAEFERELILERTQAGAARARALGKRAIIGCEGRIDRDSPVMAVATWSCPSAVVSRGARSRLLGEESDSSGGGFLRLLSRPGSRSRALRGLCTIALRDLEALLLA